ncbi:hypothetical protein J421_4828 (plasmid) [Gemmatirosa kalamazoonensis]|uniref:Uncharacterized protein n=1 Tax=Gemmatirosa kalamazoonensis TaxID=861299 RepID=W0RRZ5_9BACT|nr:hypothetical protein [Gemmatirosa kalamazoonensis]AHG92363.1 hypothetical protein J421_4828 [Gemmatirosa kalamazoonensis]
MIDYVSHTAVLARVRLALAAVADPAVDADRDELLADAAGYPEALVVGAVVDHLLMHAGTDGVELQLLGRAADLWTRGLQVYEAITAVRAGVESALADPTALTAVATFNAAMAQLGALRTALTAIGADVDSLRDDIIPLPYLSTPHPRQQDLAIAAWPWGDRFLARRTEAFVRAAFEHAKTPRARAFALGTLASYAGNVAGSSYLVHAVGGPRRTHPRRDRLARNTVGAWLRANRPLPSLRKLAEMVGHAGAVGGAPGLPPDVDGQLSAALADAYPGMPPADVALGLQRLRQHLELLSVFVRPPLPAPPPTVLMGALAPLDAVAGPIDVVEDPPPGDPGPPPPTGPDPAPGSPPGADDKSKKSDACTIVIGILVLGVVLLIDCIVHWVQNQKCDPIKDLEDALGEDGGNPDPEPDPTASQAQLVALAASPNGTMLVMQLFQYQTIAWQALSGALDFLVHKGLVYPDDPMLGTVLFTQFTALPPQPTFPMRDEVAANEGYVKPPGGAVEHPTTAPPSPYPVGASPAIFVDGAAVYSPATGAPEVAVRVWLQIARGVLDSENFDLDADRRAHAPCWQVHAGTSIDDDPLQVETLPYAAL